jgi:hypothetical protein
LAGALFVPPHFLRCLLFKHVFRSRLCRAWSFEVTELPDFKLMNKAPKKTRKTHFQQGAWGVACKNGKFYEFTDRHVLVMKGWPDPRAWYKRRSHSWRPTRKLADAIFSRRDFVEGTNVPKEPCYPFVLPDGQIALPGLSYEESRMRTECSEYAARTAFMDQVPDDIRQELQRYSNRRWHMLNLFARCPGSIDLSRSNPALAFAMASNWVFHKPAVQRPMRAARTCVWKKQKAILEWLGFPGTESVRKTLAKISANALNIEMLLYLRTAIVNPVCAKLLSHLPRLGHETVMIASNRHLMPHVTPKLLEDVLANEHKLVAPTGREKESRKVHYELLSDTLRMANIVDWEKCPTIFCSLKRARSIHDEPASKMGLARLKKRFIIPDRFDDPPFCGTEHIVPLTTPEEVCREGQLQKNCVAAYLPHISNGDEYIYRVEQPVRGTLSIVYNAGKWKSDQFYKACNQPVADAVYRDVFSRLFASRRNKNNIRPVIG